MRDKPFGRCFGDMRDSQRYNDCIGSAEGHCARCSNAGKEVKCKYLCICMFQDYFSKQCGASPDGCVQNGVGVRGVSSASSNSFAQLLQQGMARNSSESKICNLHSADECQYLSFEAIGCLGSMSKSADFAMLAVVL